MSDNDAFVPTALDEQFLAFYDVPEVKEVTKQLQDGLIHPIEYSYRILDLAKIHIG